MSAEEAQAAEGEMQEEEMASEEMMVDPVNDTMPGLLLGIQAIIGTVWWLLTMFLYIGTTSADTLTVSGTASIPFLWMFSNLGTAATMLQALSLLMTFVFYMVVSVVELVAWIVSMGGDYAFAKLWMGLIGYWGSLIAYVVPPVFAMLHALLASPNLAGSATAAGFTHDLFLMIAGFTLWIAHGLLHILFVPRFIAHIEAQPCVCSMEMPEELAEDADDEAKEAHAAAMEEHSKVCMEECPPKMECELEMEEGESKEDHMARCEEAAAAAAESDDGAEDSEGGWE
jgi:hypothetical protein